MFVKYPTVVDVLCPDCGAEFEIDDVEMDLENNCNRDFMHWLRQFFKNENLAVSIIHGGELTGPTATKYLREIAQEVERATGPL
jgi:hypothetical protein